MMFVELALAAILHSPQWIEGCGDAYDSCHWTFRYAETAEPISDEQLCHEWLNTMPRRSLCTVVDGDASQDEHDSRYYRYQAVKP